MIVPSKRSLLRLHKNELLVGERYKQRGDWSFGGKARGRIQPRFKACVLGTKSNSVRSMNSKLLKAGSQAARTSGGYFDEEIAIEIIRKKRRATIVTASKLIRRKRK